ncbi:MAG: Alkaline phosphatase synthesis transcriptional regulatory protein PhoP [Phycisphaerae bacterium]|nr:Alkaline phosphatase synthesis transcriptional regulatory protein PhoP [Phycisphaerae bacterium]
MSADVLIVDDDRAAVEALRMRMRRAGFTTREAYSGQEALREFDACRPRVAILDAALPDLSGFEVCDHIREADPAETTKVIFVSGAEAPSTEYIRRCAQAVDADAFVRKPYDGAALLEMVAEWVDRAPGRETSE